MEGNLIGNVGSAEQDAPSWVLLSTNRTMNKVARPIPHDEIEDRALYVFLSCGQASKDTLAMLKKILCPPASYLKILKQWSGMIGKPPTQFLSEERFIEISTVLRGWCMLDALVAASMFLSQSQPLAVVGQFSGILRAEHWRHFEKSMGANYGRIAGDFWSCRNDQELERVFLKMLAGEYGYTANNLSLFFSNNHFMGIAVMMDGLGMKIGDIRKIHADFSQHSHDNDLNRKSSEA